MNKLKAFVRLAPNDRALLMHAFAYLACCKFRLRLQRFEKLQAWATEMGLGAAPVEHLTWAFNIALRMMPGSTCLCQALALQRLLARNGHNAELKIGVKKLNNVFSAHAWLLLDGRVLIGGSQLNHYEPLIALKSRNDVAPHSSVDSGTG
jgi:hypothetical protein